MEYAVEVTDEFKAWYGELSAEEQVSVRGCVDVLAEKGPSLGRPYVDTVKASKYSNMKELRIQHGGRPYRIFFIFDPKQTGILLIGAVKSGTRFYRDMVPQADKIYAQYLREMGGS